MSEKEHQICLQQSNKFYKVKSDQKDEKNNAPLQSQVTVSTEFAEIKCGIYHSVGLTNAGELIIWGSNNFGQKGIPDDRLTDVNYYIIYLLMSRPRLRKTSSSKFNMKCRIFTSLCYPLR